MDIQMPEMNGIETTSKILKILEDYNKVMEESKKVKCFIVGLTSYTGDNQKQKSLAAGMNDYIFKPLKYKDLKKIMAQYFLPFVL